MYIFLYVMGAVGTIGTGFLLGVWVVLDSESGQRAIDHSMLLNARRDNGRLSRRIFKLRQQNRALRALLTANGISSKSTTRRQAQAVSH